MAVHWKQDLVQITTCELNMTNSISRRFRETYGGLEQLKIQREKRGVSYMINCIVFRGTGNIATTRTATYDSEIMEKS